MRGKKFTSADKEKVLTLVSEAGFRQFGACSRAEFEAAAGWSADTIRQLRYKDASFGARLAEAQEAFRRKCKEKCENALLRRACGFAATETEEEEELAESGRVLGRKKKTRVRHYPPDVTALKFVLSNIAPKEWREGGALQVSFADDMRRPLTPQEAKDFERELVKKYGFDDFDDDEKKTDNGGAARKVPSGGGQ